LLRDSEAKVWIMCLDKAIQYDPEFSHG